MTAQAASDKGVPNRPRSATSMLIKRLWRHYLRRHFGLLMAALLFMAIAAAMTGALAKLMEPVIDDVFAAKDNTRLYQVAAMVFGAFFIRGISTYFHNVLMSRAGLRVVADVQKDLFRHLIHADLSWLNANPSGQLISRMISDVDVMRLALAETITAIGKSVLTLLFLVVVMFMQDWKLSLGAFFVFPLAALFVARIGRRMRKVSAITQEERGEFSSILSQVFQGARQVKAYGTERQEISRASQIIDRIFELSFKARQVASLSTPVTETLAGVAIVTVIIYGGSQVISGQNTTGALFSFITAFLLAYEPLKRLARMNNRLQMGLAAAERVFDVLDTPNLVVDKPGAKSLEVNKPSISFKNVTFLYENEGEKEKALDNVTIDVPAGQTVALVGPSGAGKSTILNLVPRFYDVQKGQVTIDGININDVTLESLRSKMALVTQEVAIFDDTVRANIAYGNKTATFDEIKNAAKAAAAHDFIINMPDGYDTRLGENGVKLSGGQRQRIAIARAMLRNAPILLLDEATSALDADSERLIQHSLEKLQRGRTSIVIAHRLSTIENADLIYVMEKGCVVEQGTHAQLMKKNGLYARLYGQNVNGGKAVKAKDA